MKLIPPFGPWLMTYDSTARAGVMLCSDHHDITLSGALCHRGLVVGWRTRKHIFRMRLHQREFRR